VTLRNKRITLYLLYCVVVIALILIVTIIFRPRHTNTASTTHPTTATQHPAGKSAGKGGNTRIASKESSKSTTSGSTAPSSSKATATATTLNNTGPGNVFGLFALVSVLGGWFYRRKLIRSMIR
jgi:cytoskeletal protein RodZ